MQYILQLALSSGANLKPILAYDFVLTYVPPTKSSPSQQMNSEIKTGQTVRIYSAFKDKSRSSAATIEFTVIVTPAVIQMPRICRLFKTTKKL